MSYIKALKTISRCLRKELVSKGHIKAEYVDSSVIEDIVITPALIQLGDTLMLLVNYLYENDFDIKAFQT